MAKAARKSTQPLHLTRRERDLVLAILEGCTNAEMAERFGISEQSVKNGLSRIYEKVGVYSRLKLALKALELRLLDPLTAEERVGRGSRNV